MVAETLETQPVVMGGKTSKLAFFRQSGWMMIATVGSGVLMSLVHVYSRFIPDDEYAIFGTLLQVLNWMTIPAIGLQVVFAQQTSAAVTDLQKRQLTGTFRSVLQWTFGIWVLMVLTSVAFHTQILTELKIHNPAALWVTVTVGLMMLWQPIFQGLLQGRQNFLWLGWVAVFNGVGRLGIAGLIVFLFHGWAAGMITGALIGLVALVATSAWQNRDLFGAPSSPFQARDWLKRVIPLTLGCGTSQFLFSADMFIVQSKLEHPAPYLFGMTLARAIVLFTAPLVAVMFPKIVHSLARDQKSDLLRVTIFGTAVLAVAAAVGLPIITPLLIKYGSKPAYVSILPLMPLFAWSMVPLALGNVLLNNLMARSQFAVVPWLVAIAAGYWFALLHNHESFKSVVQTLAVFNTLLLTACAVFTWRAGRPRPAGRG